jgi:hypothetical protein
VVMGDGPPRDGSEAGAESVMMALPLICELERRKRLDRDRLKLPVEPRVERRESGVGGRSCCWVGPEVATAAVAAAAAASGADVGGTDVGACALCGTALVGSAVFSGAGRFW